LKEQKVGQNSLRDFTAQRFALGPLQCSIQSGAAELAALRHAASLNLTESPRFGGSHAQQSQSQKQRQNLTCGQPQVTVLSKLK